MGMKKGKIFIDSIRHGESDGGMTCSPCGGAIITAIKYTKNDVSKWITCCEFDSFPSFYLTDVDIYDKLIADDFDDEEFEKLLEKSHIEKFEKIDLSDTYSEIGESVDEHYKSQSGKLINCFLIIHECDDNEIEDFISKSTGKYVDELDVESGFDFSSMDQETLFKHRLYLEAHIKYPYIYDDLDDSIAKQKKKDLKKAIKLGGCGYEKWKNKYFEEKLNELKGQKFITVKYMFAGIGSYTDVIEKSEYRSFKKWIDENGSAFISDSHESTENELKIYIAKDAIDK